MPEKSGSIFDIDGTLYKGYLLIDLVQLLSSKGIFSKAELEQIDSALAKYKAGKIPYSLAAKIVVDNYALGIKGQSTLKVLALAKELVQKNIGKLFPNAKKMVAQRKKQGIVAAVSLSPIECITPLRAIFGFDYVYGLSFNSRNGKYTGQYSAQDLGNFKRNAIGTIIGVFGLDPRKTKYFGDTLGDMEVTKNLPVRRRGKTIARKTITFKPVNPDAELRNALAKKHRIKKRRK